MDEKPTSQDRLDPLYSGGTAPDLFKTGLAIKSGERNPVEATLASLMDAGKTVPVFITARDVTEKSGRKAWPGCTGSSYFRPTKWRPSERWSPVSSTKSTTR